MTAPNLDPYDAVTPPARQAAADPYDAVTPKASAAAPSDDESYWEEGSSRPPTKDFGEFQRNYFADHGIAPFDTAPRGAVTAPHAAASDPYDAVTPGVAQPAQQPWLGQRLAAFGRSLLPQGDESYAHALGRDVTGFVKAPINSALDAVAAPAVGEARRANLRAPTPSLGLQSGTYDAEHGAVTDKQRALAGLATVANIAAPLAPVGEIASPLLRAGARVAVPAVVGAANSPSDPLLGAVVGGGLGAVHAGVQALPELPLTPSRLAAVLDPKAAEEARLAKISDAATQSALQQAREYHARRDIYGQAKPDGPVQGPAPTLPFVQSQADAALPAADATLDHADVMRTIKSGWAAAGGNPFSDLLPDAVAKSEAAPQITPDENTVAGATPARATESPVAIDGTAPGGVSTRGLGATATPALAAREATGVDQSLQPALANQVEYRNAGLSLPSAAGGAVKNALDRPYAQLESNPQDLGVRNALLAAGAGATHGADVATFGMAHVRSGIDPATVRGIEAKIFADNFEMQAQSREAAGDPGAAANLRAHAELARSEAPAGIENTPAYQQYVDRYRDVMEPQYNAVAKGSGLTEENFRGVKQGSVYVPLPPDIEASAPENVVRSSAERLGTKQSSAVKVATGGAGSYVLDAQHAAQTFLPERTRIAAQNDLWQAVRSRGRQLGGRLEKPMDGEQRIAFTDKYQLTTPESPDAAHYIALPDQVADAVQQYVDRRDAPTTRGLTLNRALTQASVVASPAIGLTHGGSIAQTVNMTSGPLGAGEAARALASAAPFGNTLAGLYDMNRVDLTDPATLKNYLAVSKYGGTRPIQPAPEGTLQKIIHKGHTDLFGQNGMDARGRAVAINRTMAANPDTHPADVAQTVGQAFGQYNRMNQPKFVYTGQRSGLTSFAPAGIGFTTEAVKRMTGQRGILPFVKSTAAPVAGMAALNYALSGHSPMQNEPGHRGDVDLGYKGDDGKERYLRGSYAYPLLNRAANTTGLRPSLEGQGFSGAATGTANSVLNQAGVVPRLAFALANSQLRESPGFNGLEPAVPAQAGEGNRFLKIVQNAGSPFIGAGGSVGGFSSFDANQSLRDRVLNAVHSNAIASGRAPGTPEPNVLYQGLRDKVFAAQQAIEKATTPADKAAAMAQQMARFRDDGHTGLELQQIQMQLLKAKLMPSSLTGIVRQQAMRRQGFTPVTPK